MIEIKFRPWHKKQKKFIDYSARAKNGDLLQANGSWQDARDIEWLQYTGIEDKNGTEIYGEGDIYKDADGIISIVKMAVDGWALFAVRKGIPVQNLYWHNVCDKTKGEVIGNIYENKS